MAKPPRLRLVIDDEIFRYRAADGLVVSPFEEISAEAWARGSALAIELLEEMDLDRVCMCDEVRDGAPQDNIIYRYLQRLRREAAADSQAEQEQAFCSVLSDYIASAPEGTWDVDAIERHARKNGPPLQAVQP
jgi:hypothetical protein